MRGTRRGLEGKALPKILGLIVAPVMLMIGLTADVATAAGATATGANAAGTAVRADGTRVAAPAAVTPQDSGNNGAWVSGIGQCSISSTSDCWGYINTTSGTPCPANHFCIYQNQYAYQGGKVYSFYHCHNGGSDWALENWNGTGEYHNSDSPGTHAYIKGSSHNVLVNIPQGADNDDYNFIPAYYVQAC